MRFSLTALLIAFFASALHAKNEETPVIFDCSATFLFSSEFTGRSYQIDVAWPAHTPPPEAGWPVLYTLDGKRIFPATVGLARALANNPLGTGVHPGVVVGIGYKETDPAEILKLRARDYTLEGASAFLEFIENELKPFVENRYRVDPQRSSLFGHSYGGLFTTYALFHRPEVFENYLIASPSLWWRGNAIQKEEPFLASNLEMARRWPTVYLTSGQYEQALAPHLRNSEAGRRKEPILLERAMVDRARELSIRLAALGVDCRYENFLGSNHGDAAFYHLLHALPIAFRAPETVSRAETDSGTKSLSEQRQSASE